MLFLNASVVVGDGEREKRLSLSLEGELNASAQTGRQVEAWSTFEGCGHGVEIIDSYRVTQCTLCCVPSPKRLIAREPFDLHAQSY